MMDLKLSITKLNNENYFVWKYRMELLLIKEGAWSVVNEAKPEIATQSAEWEKRDNTARALIGLSVEDDQLIHVRTKTTAKEVWEDLKEYHERSTLSNQAHLMRKICSTKLDENGNMNEHLNNLSSLFQKLVDLGGANAVTGGWKVAIITSSLPRS